MADLAYGSEPQIVRHHLSQIESGKKLPSVRVLVGIAECLGVEVFELLLVDGGSRVAIAELVRQLPQTRTEDLLHALKREFDKVSR